MNAGLFTIEGVVPALLTPMAEDGVHVDDGALRHLCDFLIEQGVHGLMPCGTTGEGPLLNIAERKRVAEVVLEAAGGRVPVIVHVGTLTTHETIELARHAYEIGADACSVVMPYYYLLDEETLITHLSRVASSVPDMPIFLYNIPQNTGNSLSLRAVQTIAEIHPNVVGIKDSSGDLSLLIRFMEVRGGAFNVVIGSDILFFPGLIMGARACVSGNANVFPELFVSLFEAFKNADYERCRAFQEKINAIIYILGDGKDLSLFKEVLGQRGVRAGEVRPPLRQASQDEVLACIRSLRELGLL